MATLLLAVAAFAAWLAFYFSPAKRAERAARSLQDSGVRVRYDYQRAPGDEWKYSARAEPPGPTALRKVIGEGFFQDAEWINLHDTPLTVDQLSSINTLTRVRGVTLLNCQIGDEHMRHFAGLRRLEMLTLQNNQITDSGLANIAGLTLLTNVSLSKNEIRGEGLKHLVSLNGLTKLFLHDNPISDHGLVHLGKIDTLEMLGLAGTKVSDEGVKHLKTLKALRYLGLTRTSISKAAVEELRAALPLCDIER